MATRPRIRITLFTMLLAIGLLLVFASSALAHTYTVTRTDDPKPDGCKASDCSLREAVLAANKHPGPDTIVLPHKGPYNLTRALGATDDGTNGDLEITDPVTIKHSGAGKATIDAHKHDRVLDISSSTTLSKLVIRNGYTATDLGGGIQISAGNLTVANSTISGNHSGFFGGGLESFTTGTVTISASTISGNQAVEAGGGVEAEGSNATMRIKNSTIDHNSVPDGNGGGVDAGGSQTVALVNDTIANNSAERGGGISSNAHVKLNAVTVARNSDSGSVGSGGGIDSFGASSLENSIVSLNTSSGTSDDADGSFTSLGHNLSSDPFGGPGDIVTSAPKLGPLANNGGPTRTIALLKRSPAIEHGDAKTEPKRDQRGHLRDPKHPDIGAFERAG